jgi:hypothetical protein
MFFTRYFRAKRSSEVPHHPKVSHHLHHLPAASHFCVLSEIAVFPHQVCKNAANSPSAYSANCRKSSTKNKKAYRLTISLLYAE